MRTLIASTSILLLAASAGAQTIRPAAIGAHIRFLADDALEGRGTGSRGHAIAAKYVAAQYELLGLEPGAGGSWFQRVPFRRTMPSNASTITVTPAGGTPRTLAFGVDFMTTGSMWQEDANVEGDVVFVGYGITAPSLHYDDYAGVDVRGKIVALVGKAPDAFPTDLLAHYSATTTKLENAAAHGAIAVLTLRTPLDERRFSWSRTVRQYKLGSMNWLEATGEPHGIPRGIAAAASLSRDGAQAILGSSLASVDASIGKAMKPFVVPAHLAMHIVSKHEEVDSMNVVGVLRGSDPALQNEYVVYSAHLDHLGISDPVDGDSINNGAYDNASGIAAMLEVARVFAEGKSPRRSILFLATTGEEKGLRGADYFANNPTVPVKAIVADINMDEILMFHPVRDVVAHGAEHSTLGEAAQRAAQKMGILLSPDPQPEEVVFVRSDQYPFIRRGIPALFVDSGFKPVDPVNDIARETIEWEEHIYHTPKDDLSQRMDLSVGAMVARFDYLVGADVANATARPRWNKGDFFGDTFGAQ